MPERFAFDLRMDTRPPLALVAQGYFMTAERLQMLTEPTRRAIDEVLIPEVIDTFAMEGRPPWAPLADDTPRLRKGRRGMDHPILRDTDAMFNAVTSPDSWAVSEVSRGAVGGIDENILDSEAPYWHFHPSGTRYMPARDFFVTDSQVDEAIENVFQDFVLEAIDAGLGAL